MTPPLRYRSAALAILGLAVCSGCTAARHVVDPLNILGINKPPVRIGVTQFELMPPPLMLPKRALLQDDLAFHLNEPISFDLMTTRQIRVHLGTGRLQFAMLSPADYCSVAKAGNSRILAVPINENGENYRQGLIIVSAKSPIRELQEVKSLRFHFMPPGNVLNEAALAALLDAGISRPDLDAGILSLGLDTHHINSLEVAKSVVIEEKAAGVIDEVEYRKWKPTGGSLLLLNPSQDEIRIIGRTVKVPEGPVLVSEQTSPELAEKVYDYLVNVLPKHKLVLASMGYTGFAPPLDVREYEPYFAAHRKLHPAEVDTSSAPATELDAGASAPAGS